MAELPDLDKIVIIILSENQAIKDFLLRLYARKRLSAAREWQPIRIPFWAITECMHNGTDEINEVGDNTEGDPDYGDFKKLIFTVLVESPDLREFIRFVPKEVFDTLLTIDVKIIPGTLIDTTFNKPGKAIEKRRSTSNGLLGQQYIDGILLTTNEMLFEEYYADCFDEKEWMKKHRLTWKPKDIPT